MQNKLVYNVQFEIQLSEYSEVKFKERKAKKASITVFMEVF